MKITASLLLLLLGTAAGVAFGRPSPPPGAPEIDPGSMVSAVALAGTVLVMFRGRKRQ